MNTFNDTGEPVGKASLWRALVFLAAASLAYPLALFLLLPVTQNTAVQFFNPASLSLLALIFCLFDHKRLLALLDRHRLLASCVGLFSLIAAIQFLMHPVYSLEHLCLSLFWVGVPLFCCLNHQAIRRCLPYWIILLWCLNLVYGVWQLLYKAEFAGLPGNRNWQAALLLASTPIVIYMLGALLRKRLHLPSWSVGLICTIPLALSGLLFWYCESRGACLSLGICSICAILWAAGRKCLKLNLAILGGCGLAVSAWMFFGSGSDSLANRIIDDVRIPLWEGALKLISENPVIGVGQASFESEFATHRSYEYFMRPVAAVRTNHPHNHLLHITASFGVLGFFAWGILLIYPLVVFCQRIGDYGKNPILLLFFFAFLALLSHAMFDLVFDEWPTNFLAMMMLGIFWAEAWPPPEPEQEKAAIPGFLLKGCAILLSLGLALMLATTLLATNYHKSGLFCSEILKDKAAAACFFDKSLTWRKEPTVAYNALTNALTGLNNPQLALHYGKMLTEESTCRNYAHSNGFIGYSLGLLNRHAEAETFLGKEVTNFPIGIAGWYNLFINRLAMGKKEQAAESYKAVLACLKIKGLSEAELPLVLKNPELDMHPWEINRDSSVPDAQKPRAKHD